VIEGSKQLFVLRHAKSSWDDPGLDDHERPLAPRGLRAVEALADHFRTGGIAPVQVLCSSARRTRETLEGLGLSAEVLIEPELYSATPGEVLKRLQGVASGVDSVMVIGHNPTMQVLVLRLAAPGSGIDGSALVEVKRKFPTGALATLTLECDWSELAPGCARLDAFVRSKQLAAR
jgi:phosphohistidine phosphatase